MEHIGIDVHKNQSQVCILTADAELIEKRIRTDRDRLAAVLGSRPRAKILISLVRALLRREVLRVKPGASSSFVERVGELEIPKPLRREIAPILKLMTPLNRQIDRATKDVEKIVHQDSTVRRLCTAPGVGSITAASFAATIDMPERFKGAHQVEAYLGLVPRELSSGEKQRKGRITKRGDRRTR